MGRPRTRSSAPPSTRPSTRTASRPPRSSTSPLGAISGGQETAEARGAPTDRRPVAPAVPSPRPALDLLPNRPPAAQPARQLSRALTLARRWLYKLDLAPVTAG